VDNKENNTVANAFDVFNSTISELDDSYKDLKVCIQDINLQITEKNKLLESNFYKVNQLRWFFDSILNSMTDGVIVVDSAGKIVLFNQGAEKLTGFKSREVVGELYTNIFGTFVSERFSPMYTIESGKSLFLEEKQMPTKSGSPCPVRYSTSLVKESNERVLGALEVFSDLSRIKKLEKEMQQIKTQAALNQMASLVAHEVRNPLGGIRGYVDLIAESFDDDDPRNEMIKHIDSSINRLDEIVANFHLFTRPVKPHFDKIELCNYLRDVITFFRQDEKISAISFNFSTNIDSFRKPVEIVVDPVLLEQVIIAILDNAVKSIDNKGGSVCLDIEVPRKLKTRGKKNLEIIIRDTGVGMSADLMGKLFTPFMTTREKGLGLGLALARNFISLHHGDIVIDSEPGVGTTVRIVLPSQ